MNLESIPWVIYCILINKFLNNKSILLLGVNLLRVLTSTRLFFSFISLGKLTVKVSKDMQKQQQLCQVALEIIIILKMPWLPDTDYNSDVFGNK